MKYETIGQIKSVNLSSRTFTLEPISACRFNPKEDKDSYLIMFRDTSGADDKMKKVDLLQPDVQFMFPVELSSAIVMLKQNRTKIKVGVDALEVVTGDKITDAGLTPIDKVINQVQIVLP